MGHTRLGSIPKSQKWTAVIAQLAGTAVPAGAVSTVIQIDIADLVAEVANRTLDAASGGLKSALDDPGLVYTFFTLTQLALASRSDDWRSRLENVGIHLDEDATIFDLTVEIQTAIDGFLLRRGHSSDFSEMAQRAAGEAVSALVGPTSTTLFGAGREELLAAVRSLSTKNGFGILGQRFFGRFMAHFLNFYLSRVTASYLGEGYLQQVGDISRFNKALREHCDQSARIVRDFCAGWYSKTEYETGISLENSARLVAVALEKLRSELQQQRKEQ